MYIRSVTEQSCVVWGSSISEEESQALERTQKCALRLIYDKEYSTYSHALALANLPDLKSRRRKLSQVFADRCIQNEKTKFMFPLNDPTRLTRHTEKYKVPFAYHERLRCSAIPSMARYLNEKYSS